MQRDCSCCCSAALGFEVLTAMAVSKRLSRASQWSLGTNLRDCAQQGRWRGFVEISANEGVALAEMSRNQTAGFSYSKLASQPRNFGHGRLSRASWQSWRTNQRPKRQCFCRDIHDSMAPCCCAEQETHIRNRLLRLAQWNDFCPCRLSRAFWWSLSRRTILCPKI